MYVEWTDTFWNQFSQIKSKYFSEEETEEYKKRLIVQIENEILKTGTLFPSPNYKNRYYAKVKPYIISYKFSSDKSHYSVVAFKHGRQNKKH
jgi:hypothetical protein